MTTTNQPAELALEFMECDTCRAKPGMPLSCQGCLHNRAVIGKLNKIAHRDKPKQPPAAAPADPSAQVALEPVKRRHANMEEWIRDEADDPFETVKFDLPDAHGRWTREEGGWDVLVDIYMARSPMEALGWNDYCDGSGKRTVVHMPVEKLPHGGWVQASPLADAERADSQKLFHRAVELQDQVTSLREQVAGLEKENKLLESEIERRKPDSGTSGTRDLWNVMDQNQSLASMRAKFRTKDSETSDLRTQLTTAVKAKEEAEKRIHALENGDKEIYPKRTYVTIIKEQLAQITALQAELAGRVIRGGPGVVLPSGQFAWGYGYGDWRGIVYDPQEWRDSMVIFYRLPASQPASEPVNGPIETAYDRIIGRPDKPFHKAECRCAQCEDWIKANPLPASEPSEMSLRLAVARSECQKIMLNGGAEGALASIIDEVCDIIAELERK